MALLLGTFVGHTQKAMQLNLQQCRSMAVENSQTIKIANENIAKASGEKMAARSAWFPNIEASAIGLYRSIEIQEELYLPTAVPDLTTGELVPNIAYNPSTGAPIISPDGNPVFNSYAYLPLDITLQGGALAGITATQPVYAGGKIIAGNKMTTIGEQMATLNKALTQDEVIYETDKAYYLYLSVKAKVDLAKKYQNLLKEIVKMVNNSYETGMTNKNELLKVQVKYNDATLQLQQAKTGLKLTQMSLNRSIGLDLSTQLEINDSIDSYIFDAAKVNAAQVENRKEFLLMQNQTEMVGQNIKLVRGDYMPTAGVSVGYNQTLLAFKNINNYNQGGLNAMGSINIPITNFGERKGKVAVAKANYNIKQLELQQAKEYLQLEIEQARLSYIDAFTRVELSLKALEQAAENMRISDDNYSLGMEPIVNLLEAKAEWQKANSNKIDAITEFKVKESNLLRVANNLNVE